MKLLPIITALSLAGCVSSQAMYTSDGTMGHVIRCPGTLGSWGGCYAKASDLCGSRGYDILQQVGEKGFLVSGDYASDRRDRMMVVQCKGVNS